MSKPKLTTYIGARFTDDEAIEVETYIEAISTDKSDLVRNAVKEYLINHPIQEGSSDGNKEN